MSVVGKRIGRIRVESLLGRGGMGEVYVGYDETLQRQVALKSIRARHRLKARAKARFLREARVLSRLDHPNICKIHDFIEGEDRDYLVLELIQGRQLMAAIRDGLEPSRQLPIARQIVEVLVAAHAEGVVHRDLKPENVMLTDSGEIKVLDFGIAASRRAAAAREPAPEAMSRVEVESETPADATDETLDQSQISRADARTTTFADAADSPAPELEPQTLLGSIVGTPMYMSPEQARGEPVTTATDMYSFGLLLQTLFTGRGPYPPDADRPEIMRRAVAAETLPVTGIDADLTRLIEALKVPAPAARPTAVEAARRLRWIADRPRRRAKWLVAAAALAVLALGGLKYTLDLRRERMIAVEAREEADLRRGQAEDLIGFMLGDLRAKLEPVGRLEILDDVGDKALEYFASLPEQALSDDELSRRSKALNQIGDVRMSQGDLGAATTAFEESLALAQDLASRQPLNDQWQLDLGAAHFWIGYALMEKGELAGAMERFTSYYEISQRLVDKDPENPDWQLELAYSHNNLAAVLELQGDLAAALRQFEASAGIRRRLLAMEPDDPLRRRDLANSLSVLGTALESSGRWQEALNRLEEALEIRRELVQRDPDHTDWRELLTNSHSKVGRLRHMLGELDLALEHFAEDLELTRTLVARDASNTRWLYSLARTEALLGEALIASEDPEGALEHFLSGESILGDLVGRQLGGTPWQVDLAGLRLGVGTALLEGGRPNEALARAEAALATLEPMVGETASPATVREETGRGHLLRGLALQRLHRGPEARQAWNRGLEVLEPVARESRDPRLLDPWVRTLLLLERVERARPLVKVLGNLGYREPGFLRLCTAMKVCESEPGSRPANPA